MLKSLLKLAFEAMLIWDPISDSRLSMGNDAESLLIPGGESMERFGAELLNPTVRVLYQPWNR